MRIVISYHNFIRDYRGSRLLAQVLHSLGHWVIATPHWNSDTKLIETFKADVVVGCQVAEKTTSYLADFTQKAGIPLVINSSEQFTSPEHRRVFVTYNGDDVNEPYIAFQAIACQELEEFIAAHPKIHDKSKYRLIGFPRYDLAISPTLRSAETPSLRERYQLSENSKHAIYVSSLLFSETFEGVPEEDMKRFKYVEVADRNERISQDVFPVLHSIVDRLLDKEGKLLIKKHPWDVSDRIEKEFANNPRVSILQTDEYIVPCMDACEYILHSFSTSAIEAWIMNKKTVAILPEEYRAGLDLSHMIHEVKTEGIEDTLEVLQNYPQTRTPAVLDEFLSGKSDGRSTIRLAAMIHQMEKPKHKQYAQLSTREYLRNIRRYYANLNGRGFMGPGSESPKMQMLHRFETTRRNVDSIYRNPFQSYIAEHQKYLQELIQ